MCSYGLLKALVPIALDVQVDPIGHLQAGLLPEGLDPADKLTC